MTDIKVYGLLVVDGDVDAGVPGTANMGKAYDDLRELEQESGEYMDALVEAWAATGKEQDDHEATIQMFNETLATYGKVVGERETARGIAVTLYLVLEAALKAFNAEPYGEEQYQKDARKALWDLLETTPEWIQRMDGAL